MRDEAGMMRGCILSCRNIFSVSLLGLIIQASLILPNKALAQANTDRLRAAARETNQTQDIAATLESAILSEINRARTNPQGYALWLEEQRQYYDGIWLRLPGEKATRTNRGRKALEEAIAFLKKQQPLPPLEISEKTANKATLELENFATANNIQFFSYGRKTAEGIVMGLVVDDLFPDRRRRQSLLSPDAEDTGVVCQPHPQYAKVCAIAYSDSSNAASAEPEISIPGAAQVPEIVVPSESSPDIAASVPQDEAATASTEKVESEKAEEENLATLPAPPAPQTPPLLGTAVDLEVEESETAKSALDNPQDTASPETSAEAPEPEATAESEPKTETPVAAKPDDDRLLQKVEHGSLESGDRTIAEDGSLYDFYPLQGKAGESYTIYLESDEFDAFVALVDSKGNTIKENDDISEENSNSRIRVTLPEDGTYNIIVNTYDQKGTGKYILTLSR